MMRKTMAIALVLCALCLGGCGARKPDAADPERALPAAENTGGDAENTGEATEAPGEDEGSLILALDDGELIEYLLAHAQEANERVNAMRGPLEARVPGNMTDLPDVTDCRDVWLGYEKGGAFDVIIQYTIDPGGRIYEYFPDDEAWGLLYVPGAVG